MLSNFVFLKIFIVLTVFVGLFTWERLRPFAKEKRPQQTRNHLIRTFSLWALNVALSFAIILPLTQIISQKPVITGIQSIIVDILLLDIFLYWWHRFLHESRFLWRFHQVHHFDTILDCTSALRFHFGEVFLAFLTRSLFVVTVGISFTSIIIFETLVLIAALFHHSNIRLHPKIEHPLSYLIVTPSIHWVHHEHKTENTNTNYATIFSVWDRLFKSRNSKCKRDPQMKIGLNDHQDKPLKKLLLIPFRK